MSEYDKWEVAGVLPDDFQSFDDWAVQTPDLDMNGVTEGTVYHRHIGDGHRGAFQSTLYMTKDGKCRRCGAQAPPGVLFMARTVKLHDIGV